VVLGPFWPIFSVTRAVKSTSKLKDKIGPVKDFYFCILSWYCTDARDSVIYWCHCRRDADIFQPDSMRQHIMHIRQLSYCCKKLRSSSVRPYERPIAPILILLIITYGAWCRIMCIWHNSRRGRSETMLGWHLEWLLTKCCGRCHWWMA